MRKKLIKRIAVITFFFVTGFSIIGCSRESVPNKNSQPPSVTQSNSVEEKIGIIKNIEEAGPGPLTKENVSLAGIHIGDSQEQVLKLYGEPTKKADVYPGAFYKWDYEDLGLSITFYRRGEQEPVEGVLDVKISAPSKLTTNTGIGIGDSLESILNKYDEVYGSKRQGEYRSVFINGANKYEVESPGSKEKIFVTYYPDLIFELEHNRITNIILSNEQHRP